MEAWLRMRPRSTGEIMAGAAGRRAAPAAGTEQPVLVGQERLCPPLLLEARHAGVHTEPEVEVRLASRRAAAMTSVSSRSDAPGTGRRAERMLNW